MGSDRLSLNNSMLKLVDSIKSRERERGGKRGREGGKRGREGGGKRGREGGKRGREGGEG